ncbi:hypothetical protein ZWY2020_021839 [Hordeum vulgare]|nr:hypothetical protein ZWY2020_021839 [Hordeum vulgare]
MKRRPQAAALVTKSRRPPAEPHGAARAEEPQESRHARPRICRESPRPRAWRCLPPVDGSSAHASRDLHPLPWRSPRGAPEPSAVARTMAASGKRLVGSADRLSDLHDGLLHSIMSFRPGRPCRRREDNVMDAFAAEAHAMSHAVSLVADLGIINVEFETDSQLLLEALDMNKADSSAYAAVIEDTKYQLKMWFPVML